MELFNTDITISAFFLQHREEWKLFCGQMPSRWASCLLGSWPLLLKDASKWEESTIYSQSSTKLDMTNSASKDWSLDIYYRWLDDRVLCHFRTNSCVMDRRLTLELLTVQFRGHLPSHISHHCVGSHVYKSLACAIALKCHLLSHPSITNCKLIFCNSYMLLIFSNHCIPHDIVIFPALSQTQWQGLASGHFL